MLTALLLMTLAAPPDEAKLFGPWPSPWTKWDTGIELVLAAEIAVDVGQSIYGIAHGGRELNPLLPRHPTRAQFYVAGTAGLLVHAAVAYVLPVPLRETWQSVVIAIEGANVLTNGGWDARIGLRLSY